MFEFLYKDILNKTIGSPGTSGDLVAGRSQIDRNGMFASRDFRKGEEVYVLNGKEIDIPTIEKIYLDGLHRITTDGFQISDQSYLFLDTYSSYINHSCNPTCGVTERSTLIALRDIFKGEEITYDYSSVEWTPHSYCLYDSTEWPMICRCGAQNCRKIITCFPYLPEDVKQRFFEAKMLPSHILKKCSEPAEETRCLVCEHVLEIRKKA